MEIYKLDVSKEDLEKQVKFRIKADYVPIGAVQFYIMDFIHDSLTITSGALSKDERKIIC